MRCTLFLILAMISSGVSLVAAAPSLLYSTLVTNTSFYNPFYVADADSEGNLYIVVLFDFDENPGNGSTNPKVYRVNSTGTDVEFVADLAEYTRCRQVVCRESGIYLRVENFWNQIVKITPDGTVIYTTDSNLNLSPSEPYFIDEEGNLYLGFIVSPDDDTALIPVTPDAVDPDYNGGYDTVIQKYDPDGHLLYCSFIGGSGDDQITGLNIDSNGAWYLNFSNISADFPYPVEGDSQNSQSCVVTISPEMDVIHGHYSTTPLYSYLYTTYRNDSIYQNNHGLLDKYSLMGEPIWSMDCRGDIPWNGSYYEPSSWTLQGFAVDDQEHIYTVRGVTRESPFTVTSDALYANATSDGDDLGIWQVSDDAELLYGTYFGGSSSESTNADAVVFRNGVLYVVGYTLSTDLPLTAGSYIDTQASPDHSWAFFALALDFGDRSNAVTDQNADSPEALILDPPHPNPFNPATTISFTLPEAGLARLAVYNISGQLVRELAVDNLPAGRHEIVWDGCNSDGAQVSSGVYIARLAAGENTAVRKVTLVR